MSHKFFKHINDMALKSIIFEVSTSPKPGLVDRYNSGAHRDMDYFSFINSSLSLNGYFYDVCKLGYDFKGQDLRELLGEIRPLGILAEERMFKATGGINTQKGIIFSLGIIASASGYIYRNTGSVKVDGDHLRSTVRLMTKDLTSELRHPKNRSKPTYGEYLYRTYGFLGIRGEVEEGFPTVFRVLKTFEEEYSKKLYPINDLLVHSLLGLMAITEDSNILGRGGLEALEYVRDRSWEILKLGGYLRADSKDLVEDFDRDLIGRNLSPGGSADLLSVLLMIFMLKRGVIFDNGREFSRNIGF